LTTIIPGIASYLSNDVALLDVLSQNVANMRTTGYRAERLATDFRSGLLDDTPTLNLPTAAFPLPGIHWTWPSAGQAFSWWMSTASRC